MMVTKSWPRVDSDIVMPAGKRNVPGGHGGPPLRGICGELWFGNPKRQLYADFVANCGSD